MTQRSLAETEPFALRAPTLSDKGIVAAPHHLASLAGAEVLFTPFSTDESRAYQRVRYCAQARAVENVIYTVLSGNVGNLPQVENFLINYGETVICTPSDFAFPTDAVAVVAEKSGQTAFFQEP